MSVGEPELQALCKEWQARLGLAHWEIAIRFGRRDEFSDGALANVIHQDRLETALVKILDPNDWPSPFPQGIEQSIVHELLHVAHALCEPDGGYYGTQEICYEQVIDRLAKALVALKREGKAQPKE
jgi:hypothetical protein